MPILVSAPSGTSAVEASEFPSEDSLEMLLFSTPELLRPEGGSPLSLVGRQVNLGEAGYLDLLFVNDEGLPIAVEVKLAKNGESRREVVAQAVDYISALTTFTNEELDQIVDGGLERALRVFDNTDEVGNDFERRWQAVGANLRGGLARLVIALDDAVPGLERMVRFLAQNSELDVQLVAVERYAASEIVEVVVPRFLVGAEAVKPRPVGDRQPRRELLRAVEEYNATASKDLEAVGTATYYRLIRPADWPAPLRTHYEFYQTSTYIGTELHIESDRARPIASILMPFDGKPVVGDKATLVWDANWSSKRGRLTVRLPLSTDPKVVAQAMRELIELTRGQVEKRLGELAKMPPQNATEPISLVSA